MGRGRGRGGALHSQEGSSFLEPQGTWKEPLPPVARPPQTVALGEGSPPLPSFFVLKQIQKQPVWGLRARRALRELCPQSCCMEGSAPNRMGPGREQTQPPEVMPAPRPRRAGGQAPTVPSVLAQARLPSAPPPALCFLTGRSFLFLCFSPRPGPGHLQPGVGVTFRKLIVKNPNHYHPLPLTTWGEVLAT